LKALGQPTGHGITVAVIDSGWNRGVDEPRCLPGTAFVHHADSNVRERSDDDHDRLGHGTACAKLVLRVAGEAEIVPVRIFGGRLRTTPATVAQAIEWSAAQDCQVINLSLGSTDPGAIPVLYRACMTAAESGAILVAAAHPSALQCYPASFDCVLGVRPGRFGSRFNYLYLPDEQYECVAQGTGEDALPGPGVLTRRYNVSSAAASTMAGIVALFLQRFPGTTLNELRNLLREHAPIRLTPSGERQMEAN
jgi:subtilisin family serine protease